MATSSAYRAHSAAVRLKVKELPSISTPPAPRGTTKSPPPLRTTTFPGLSRPNNTTTGGGGVVNVTAIHDSTSPAGGGYSGNCATIGITVPDLSTDDHSPANPLKFAPGGIEPVANSEVAAGAVIAPAKSS